MTSPAPESKIVAILWWSLLAMVTLCVIGLRIRLLPFPLERDEGEYAYAGQLMLEGIPPYQLAYNMKFPGTYAAYALIMALFGQTTIAIHVGLLLMNLATMAFIFFLSRRLHASDRGAIAAAAAYAIMSLAPTVYGFSAHATQFIAFIISGALLLLLHAVERKSLGLLLVTGAAFGLAVLMKQPAIAFVVFGAGYLLFYDIQRRTPLNRAILRAVVFIFGAAIPLAITMLLLWQTGVFGKFWFWTVRYAAQYGSLVPVGIGLKLLGRNLAEIVPANIGLWLIGTAAFIGTILRDTWDRRLFIGGLMAASVAALSAGLYFRAHYFVLVLPVLALLVGAAITYVDDKLVTRSRALNIGVVLLLAGALFSPLLIERYLLWEIPPEIASKIIYNDAPFPESIVIADYIREHSSPNDTVAVAGSEPQIYFYSHRHSATGYIYTYGLMEPQKFSQTMQREMIQEIEKARPKFLVNVGLGPSWNRQPDSDATIFNWVDRYTAENYHPVGLVNLSQTATEYHFEQPITASPWPDCVILYERNGNKTNAGRD